MSDPFVVAGFQGEFTGNEKRVQRRLPLFWRAGDDSFVYGARHLHWTYDLLEADVFRVPADSASEYGQLMDTGQPIWPGEYVVVMGESFVTDLMVLKQRVTGTAVIEGFEIVPMSEGDFENVVSVVDRAARLTFDTELAAGALTDTTQAALRVIWGVGPRDYRGAVIRDLAAAYIAPDADRFRRLIRIASMRLGDPSEKIKAEVIDYLAIIRRDTKLLEREVVTAPSR